MTVYVDELRNWGAPVKTCHMTADTIDELKAFARYAGIPKSRWHRGSAVPHYDLNRRYRELAIALGAVERSAREQAEERIAKRKGAGSK